MTVEEVADLRASVAAVNATLDSKLASLGSMLESTLDNKLAALSRLLGASPASAAASSASSAASGLTAGGAAGGRVRAMGALGKKGEPCETNQIEPCALHAMACDDMRRHIYANACIHTLSRVHTRPLRG